MVELWKVLVIQFGFGGAMLVVWLLTMRWVIRKQFPWMLRLFVHSHEGMIDKLSVALKEERESCKEERKQAGKLFNSALVEEREERRIVHKSTLLMQERVETTLAALVAGLRGGASG